MNVTFRIKVEDLMNQALAEVAPIADGLGFVELGGEVELGNRKAFEEHCQGPRPKRVTADLGVLPLDVHRESPAGRNVVRKGFHYVGRVVCGVVCFVSALIELPSLAMKKLDRFARR
jgi:hypothetical protein